MNRPNGWIANPQAVAAVTQRLRYQGHESLGEQQDVDTWLTPRWILDQLGRFDMDPCAALVSPYWVSSKSHLTKDDDGLNSAWIGRVFMNPPFSRTAKWLERHACHGIGISLVPATVEAQVWRKHVWTKAKAVLLLHGRTRFCNPDGSQTTGRPLRSIALIAWTDYDAEVLGSTTFAGVLIGKWDQR